MLVVVGWRVHSYAAHPRFPGDCVQPEMEDGLLGQPSVWQSQYGAQSFGAMVPDGFDKVERRGTGARLPVVGPARNSGEASAVSAVDFSQEFWGVRS